MPAGTDLSQVVSFRGIIKGNLKATKLHVAASLLFHFFVSTTAMAAAKGLRRWDRIIYASHEQVKVVMVSLTAHGRSCLNDWFLIIRPRYVQRCSWIIVHLTSHLTAHMRCSWMLCIWPHSTYPLPPSQWNGFQTNQHVMFTSAHVFMWPSNGRVPPGKSYSALHRIRLQQNKS